MAATPLDEVRVKFPDLPMQLILFFDLNRINTDVNQINPKSVMEFIHTLSTSGIRQIPNIAVILEMCRRLEKIGWLNHFSSGGVMGLENRYITAIRDTAIISTPAGRRMIDCAMYGFVAVYDNYNSSVIPLSNFDKLGDQQIGTAFCINSRTLVTATHCIVPAQSLAIRGILPQYLNRAAFYIHKNEALDLSLIVLNDNVLEDVAPIPLPTSPAKILDEVMALGYPNIPGFNPTLAAEAATISGRLSATRGKIASQPAEIFSRSELFLITARVRGGFSGGPVFDYLGQAVGVVSREPVSEASTIAGTKYDELGYGTAIPSDGIHTMLDDINTGRILPTDMSGVSFREFI